MEGEIMSEQHQDSFREELSREEITILRKARPGIAFEAIATNIGRRAVTRKSRQKPPKP
jgi:hypothetical protein